MATQQEKEQLIETLKFTPRTYTVSMWGYGGEKVMGTVDQEQYDYCMANQVNLDDIAWDSDAAEEMGLDESKLPFPPGSWYECDNMGHVSGVSRDAGTIQVLDENGETVFERRLEACDGMPGSPELCCNDEVWIGSRAKGEIVFVGSSNEKGTFFDGEIELTAPFDPEKLQLHYDDFDGEDIVNGLYYNDEEIDNSGGGTDGKSSDFVMVQVIDDHGSWKRYDPADTDNVMHETSTDNPIDFPEPACKSEVELPETTDWFPVNVNPVHTGVYEIMVNATGTWPFPNLAYYTWTGKHWTDVDGNTATIYQWRGLKEKVE